MTDSERREARFQESASRSLEEVVIPKLEALASAFPNANSVERSAIVRAVSLTLRSSGDYPIGADVSLALGHDEGIREIVATWRVAIMPILMDYEREAVLRESLERFDPDRLGDFVEERLLQFTQDYLRVHEPGSPYLESVMVTDPVCGMRFHPTEAATSAERDGKTYYFCADSCRRRFEADPA